MAARLACRRLSTPSRIASRADHGPVLSVPPIILRKRGIEEVWSPSKGTETSMLSIGRACSEVFQGEALRSVLIEGHEYEKAALDALAADGFASPLVQHTSAALPPQYDGFNEELAKHLPESFGDDWCVSLQVEGASAVLAAVELLLQLQQARGRAHRTKVAVADRSYHGPPSSSLGVPAGAMTAVGRACKPEQLVYPAPHIFRDGDAASLRAAWADFFAEHGGELGCVVVEPQWGSSCAAAPWPKELLAEFVSLARSHGALVLADEIMCGLGRHGQGTLFLVDAWGIEVDCVTFGKAIASGVFPMAGAVLARGAAELHASGKTLGQSHTYAASSPRALLAATAVLREIPRWRAHMTEAADALDAGLKRAAAACNGKVVTHGLGLMRGACFVPSVEPAARVEAAGVLKAHCKAEGVWPYFVPAGGVMCTPPYNVPVETVVDAGRRMEAAFGKTAADMGW